MSNEPVDLMKPWTVKSLSTRVIEGIAAAARRENLTVGQWVEKRYAEWEGQGSPTPSGNPAADLVALLHAAAVFAAAAKLPREVRLLISDTARQARGLPGRQPDHTLRLPGLHPSSTD